jgi:hypothetical protein
MNRPIHTAKVGIISKPRPIETGVRFIRAEDRRSQEWLAGGTAINDSRWHNDEPGMWARKIGFTR